ncbi:MAG: response regulator [Nitrospirales bacterium]|nr:response regulator [Nitrospirales bacterium]
MKEKVLIVEDSAFQAEVLRRLLTKEGYEAVIARNGLEGLEMAGKEKPSLIISDISMPIMDGYEMCRQAKHDEILRDIPIILLTQLTDISAIVRGLDSGADAYITKPYSERYLLAKVVSVLRGPEKSTVLEAAVERSDKYRLADFLMSGYENTLELNCMLTKAQEELTTANEHLSIVNKELEQSNFMLRELDRLKSVFIASSSHELKTPLNAIIGFAGVLLKELSGALNPEQKKDISIIMRSGKHLLSLINDIIDVSRIEGGTLSAEIGDFELSGVIQEACSSLEPEIREKGLELKTDLIEVPMHSDRRRLLQCVLNLVSNAVKFTEKGSVRIISGLSPSLSGFVAVSVEDTGIGIKEEDIRKLFQPFVRIDSPLRAETVGTGLGLYLTKKLVAEVLRGERHVESTYGKGSRFTIVVPVNAELAAPEQKALH